MMTTMQTEGQRTAPADYLAMKQRIVRQARTAQAAAIRAALASLIATAVSFATPPAPSTTRSAEPELGD
jgi:hypothetical protein